MMKKVYCAECSGSDCASGQTGIRDGILVEHRHRPGGAHPETRPDQGTGRSETCAPRRRLRIVRYAAVQPWVTSVKLDAFIRPEQQTISATSNVPEIPANRIRRLDLAPVAGTRTT